MPKKKLEKKVSEEDAKLLEELKRLMREGRRAYAKRDLEEAKKLFSEGQELAHEKGWKEDAAVFKGSILIADKKYNEAINLLTPLLEKGTLHLKGHAYDRLGYAQYDLEQYDKAIISHQKSLDDPNYDTPGKTWNNMGLAYDGKGDYDKAIECFEKALKSPNYDAPGMAWNNMGIAYHNKGNYDKALEYYRKALDTPDYGTPGYSWFNMGLTYRDKGEFDEALEWLKKARDWYKENELEEVGRVDSIIRSIKREMQLRKSGLDEAAEEFGEIARLSPKEPEDPLGRIRDILAENRNKVEDYAALPGTKYKDVLVVLKGWSSSVPIVSSVDHERFSGQLCYGGGYFIKAGTQGIVIDPGLDFVTNFGATGEIKGSNITKDRKGEKTEPRKFHVREVTQVLVSHHHIDHCVDVGRICDLEHQWLTYDSKAKANVEAGKRDRIHYYFDHITFDSHPLAGTDVDPATHIHRLDLKVSSYDLGDSVKLVPFTTDHDEEIKPTFGFILQIKFTKREQLQIGYTSDTRFFEGNGERKGLVEQLRDCDIIIAHFAHADPEDFKAKEKKDGSHLSFPGIVKLIQGTSAKLYIISEFWGGRGDYRIELAQKLRYDFKREGREVKIIPGDVGCLIGLRELDIRCSSCDKWVPYGEIVVGRPEVPFGKLRYLCRKCRLG